VEPFEHRDSDGDGDAGGHAGAFEQAQHVRHRRPGDVLHDDEQLGAFERDVERRHDVGVANARREAGLVEQHRCESRVLRELRVQPLDGDHAGEPGGADCGARSARWPCRPRRFSL